MYYCVGVLYDVAFLQQVLIFQARVLTADRNLFYALSLLIFNVH